MVTRGRRRVCARRPVGYRARRACARESRTGVVAHREAIVTVAEELARTRHLSGDAVRAIVARFPQRAPAVRRSADVDFTNRRTHMLTITIDLVPGGFAPARRTIATMRIANVSGLADRSDYRIEAMEARNPLTGTPPRSAACEVTGHDRRQSIWALVAKAAEAVLKAEHDEL
jgi:hypothetical protein